MVSRFTALRRPRDLRPGDTVVVIAPSTTVTKPEIRPRVERGLEVLRSWQLEVTPSEHLWATHPSDLHLAGTDVQRAADLLTAWQEAEVAAIACARGGYGMQRLFEALPPGTLGQGEGKWLFGLSDITPLLHRINREAGVWSLHGPAVSGLGDGHEESNEQLRRLLFGEVVDPLLDDLVAWHDDGGETVSGHLVGGNVALLAASVGTDDLVPAAGGIVVLEDIGQPAFVLDRGLTQLRRAGWFDGVNGIVLGDFSMSSPDAEVEAVLRDRLLPLGMPVWSGGAFGHAPRNLALPHGAPVALGGGVLRLADE